MGSKEIEPHVGCLAGIRVYSTGIVNYTSRSRSNTLNWSVLREGICGSILKLKKSWKPVKVWYWKPIMAHLQLALSSTALDCTAIALLA